MKNGMIETRDGDLLLGIHKEFDLYGNQKRPLTTEEQVLLFAIGKGIQEGKVVSVNGGDDQVENANKTKFKSCPFCGKQATIKVNASTLNAYVHCANCNVTMKKNYKGATRIEEVLIELIATDWNRRVDNGLSGSN